MHTEAQTAEDENAHGHIHSAPQPNKKTILAQVLHQADDDSQDSWQLTPTGSLSGNLPFSAEQDMVSLEQESAPQPLRRSIHTRPRLSVVHSMSMEDDESVKAADEEEKDDMSDSAVSPVDRVVASAQNILRVLEDATKGNRYHVSHAILHN
jgi:hypothetical protein